MCLGADCVGVALPPELAYWRDFAAHYVAALCASPNGAERAGKPTVPLPSDAELALLAAAAPPMVGAEYLTEAALADLWRDMDMSCDAELENAAVTVQEFLRRRNPAWNLVRRVHFNLGGNRKDEEAPFAFLATYTTNLSSAAKAQHLPLGKALTEYAGAENRERLLSLLVPVQRAAGQCSWLQAMVGAGEIYHTSQWLGDGAWAEADSGKLMRLREITEEIAARQEKALIFTQFKETTAPLAAFLGQIFGRPGLLLTGDTEVKKRKELVQQFQQGDDVPFFVLSVKAGGAGLNLTAASHVIHFDRWWNPAVENQATDRAFRIGQTRNVLVHKFVCRGTVEDRIDKMIEQKNQLAGDFLSGGADMLLTELKDDELLKLVALDLNAAMTEGWA